METAAIQIRRRSSLLPALLLAVSVVGAFELSSRLMNYVQEEFGTEAQQRLENWQRLHALASNVASRLHTPLCEKTHDLSVHHGRPDGKWTHRVHICVRQEHPRFARNRFLILRCRAIVGVPRQFQRESQPPFLEFVEPSQGGCRRDHQPAQRHGTQATRPPRSKPSTAKNGICREYFG